MKPLICPLCLGKIVRSDDGVGFECFHCGTAFAGAPHLVQTHQRKKRMASAIADRWKERITSGEAQRAFRLGLITAADLRSHLSSTGKSDRDADLLIALANSEHHEEREK